MATSSDRKQHRRYPEPMIIEPKTGEHSNSLILLHGRGSNGETFGSELLETTIPDFNTLRDALPNARFIFPTAAKRRAQIYKRSIIHQWFDNWSLQTPTEREELQFEGLRESSLYIHGLLEAEIEAVGAENVILWGLSQGCALSLITLLVWPGLRLAAAVGTCGWLPLRARIERAVLDDCVDEDDDPFAVDDGESRGGESGPGSETKACKAARYLREELEVQIDTAPGTEMETPLFLSHGTEDEKVPIELGIEAGNLMRTLDVVVETKQYAGLGHWYSGEMLSDILLFIEEKAGWSIVRSPIVS